MGNIAVKKIFAQRIFGFNKRYCVLNLSTIYCVSVHNLHNIWELQSWFRIRRRAAVSRIRGVFGTDSGGLAGSFCGIKCI